MILIFHCFEIEGQMKFKNSGSIVSFNKASFLSLPNLNIRTCPVVHVQWNKLNFPYG